MKRTGLSILSLTFVAALAACGSDTKADTTLPKVDDTTAEPDDDTKLAEPTEPVVEEPAEPAEPPPPPPPTYLHGKWVWFELTTSDIDAASKFYGEVLGWTVESKEMNGMKYSSITAGGKELGMIQALPEDAKKKKLSPLWMSYVSVADVDAAVTAATEGGATVVLPAMDMAEVGRFAVLTDPWGAAFGVVKSIKSDPADAMPATGEFIWIEHLSKDAKKTAEAQAFYGKVAGYEFKTMKVGKMDYAIGTAGGIDRIGFMKAEKAAWAGKFVPYIVVTDTDATVKQVTGLKGKVLAKAQDVPNVGRIAMLADPQGAPFAVITPAPMPAMDAAAAEKPATP